MHRLLFKRALAVTAARMAVATLLFGVLLVASAGQALAHSDPANCSATGVALFFSVFESDGVTPATSAAPGDTLIYQATLGHAGDPQCNYEGGFLTITTPDGVVTNVAPGGVPLVSEGAPFVSDSVEYDVECAGVTDGELLASTEYTDGESHFGADHVAPLEATAPIATPIEFECEPSMLVTEVHDPDHTDITGMSVPAGTEVHDEATLSDMIAFEAGEIIFTLYVGENCDGEPVGDEDVSFGAGLGPIIVETTPVVLEPGAYSYQASYAGDDEHLPATAACEPFTIEEEVLEGCTPGYWKQEQHFDSWPAPYTPETLFSEVFGSVITVRAGGQDTIEDPTLLQALDANGGGVNALARQAVAALLNAASPDVDFSLTPDQVIALVQAALDSGDPAAIEATKDLLEDANEQVCPLS